MWVTSTKDKEKQLLFMAANTGGYFTAKQALQVGYNYRLQHYHRQKGHWEEIDRGVFRLTEYPFAERDDLIRWSLWSLNRQGLPQAVVSHETALAVYDISDIMPAKIHLTVPFTFRKIPPGACVLHRGILGPEEIEQREGFLITKPLKTLVDVAETHLSLDYLEQAVRDAFRLGLVSPTLLQEVSVSASAREKFRTILENIKKRPI